ncbi:hypothetical protein V2J09_020479 [Rumex salicifolius]
MVFERSSHVLTVESPILSSPLRASLTAAKMAVGAFAIQLGAALERLELRHCKAWSKHHLPEDLWPEILTRLPVKSLLRFRCVSKSWLAFIDDTEFARLHLRNFKNNSNETRLFVIQDIYKYEGCVRCSDTFKPISKTPFSLDWSWIIVFIVDGLLLVKSSKIMRLWNPSLPLPLGAGGGPLLMDIEIGLGYDPLAKDYKIVSLIFASKTTRLQSVAIYTLGAGSWKIIPFQGNVIKSGGPINTGVVYTSAHAH